MFGPKITAVLNGQMEMVLYSIDEFVEEFEELEECFANEDSKADESIVIKRGRATNALIVSAARLMRTFNESEEAIFDNHGSEVKEEAFDFAMYCIHAAVDVDSLLTSYDHDRALTDEERKEVSNNITKELEDLRSAILAIVKTFKSR